MSGSLKQLPRPLLSKDASQHLSLGRVHPSFAKEGKYACIKYQHANDTSRTIEIPASTSHRRSSASVKRNLDSSAFAKEGWLRHKEMAPFLSRRRRGGCFNHRLYKSFELNKR